MSLFFFFNDTATTEIYTLSLHDALPISVGLSHHRSQSLRVWAHLLSFLSRGRILLVILFDSATVAAARGLHPHADSYRLAARSEEHTSELQSQSNLVCRLLLEKKKKYWHSSVLYQPTYTFAVSSTRAYAPLFGITRESMMSYLSYPSGFSRLPTIAALSLDYCA